MALKRIKTAVTGDAPKAAKNGIPVILVKDDPKTGASLIADYNQAAADEKAAKARKDKLRPSLQELGLPTIFEHNGTKGNEIVASVKLVQQRVDAEGNPVEPDGKEAVLSVQFKDSYGAVDADTADEAFTRAFPEHDINDYVVETVTGTFDPTIWLRADGTVDRKVYNAMLAAVKTVVEHFDLRDEAGNLRTALVTKKIAVPRPTFHQQRWEDFTVEEQAQLSTIFPNQVALAPARTQ